ncbi:MAG: helix-turn-helix transcriptional regulator [Lachnospiraceae bacterium]|nr:helix-turn-helix transcriptional regulator [Lachnospiraceae bacterium]
MKFNEELNRYMNELDISANELSRASGLSPDVISRYINGKRTPKADSDYFNSLIEALDKLAVEKGITLDKLRIQKTLEDSIVAQSYSYDYEVFIDNFNFLQEQLGLSNASLGKAMGYDSSYISRVKNKNRRVTDIDDFVDKLAGYIATAYRSNEKLEQIADILECKVTDIDTEDKYISCMKKWFVVRHNNYDGLIGGFLTKVHDFDLSDFTSENISKIKIPTSPVTISKSKTYYGVRGRKASEEDFIRTTLISKSNEDIFFYNDLPMSKDAEDEGFKKRYVTAMAMLLKKGLHMNIVHNIDRPLEEMILGIEGWLPMYMTGAISPYYFPAPPSNMFCTSHMTSGSAALSGECIKGSQERGRFYMTTKKEELSYYKVKSKYLLKKAKPLMVIYTSEDNDKFEEFIEKEDGGEDKLRHITSENFKNMDFIISKKWIAINKKLAPEIHFVIYNDKLNSAIRAYLLG